MLCFYGKCIIHRKGTVPSLRLYFTDTYRSYIPCIIFLCLVRFYPTPIGKVFLYIIVPFLAVARPAGPYPKKQTKL